MASRPSSRSVTRSAFVKITPLVKRANRAYLQLLVNPASFNSAVTELLKVAKLANRARNSLTREALLTFVNRSLAAIRFCILTLPKTFGMGDLSRISLYLQAA